MKLQAFYLAKFSRPRCHAESLPAFVSGVGGAIVNGLPGLVLRENDGAIDTMAFEHRDGRITAIYATRNPDKLQHVKF